jgi:hypothetical protein
MSVQKRPDKRGGVDPNKVHWEQDLRPFTRLPRDKRPDTRQRIPAWVSMLVSLIVIIPLCLFLLNQASRLRPATLALIPTATIIIITPSATPFVPPTATPYVAPTETPPPTAASAVQPGSASGIVIGGRVKVSGTGEAGALNLRDKPTTAGALLRKLPEGNVYEVVGGPQEADNYTWWQIKDPNDGVVGWGAQRFLQPAP